MTGKVGIIVSKDLNKMDLFNEFYSENRDDCLEHFRVLKQKLAENSIELILEKDKRLYKKIDFYLHFEIPKNRKIELNSNNYLVRFECDAIYRNSYKPNKLKKYRKVFSWNSSGVDQSRFVQIYFPNKLLDLNFKTYKERSKLCCLIAGNKSLAKRNENDLYIERLKTIKWFESNALREFDLYGTGWEYPAAQTGYLGKLKQKILKRLGLFRNKSYFPSYRGKAESKYEILNEYLFNICYENVAEQSNYVTEKIIDSLMAGCIPVYWGAKNIAELVPGDCYIDRKNFKSHEELYKYLKNIEEKTYLKYQESIKNFLRSNASKKFSSSSYAQLVSDTLLNDLEAKS